MDLDVRRRQPGTGPEERPRGARGDGQGPLAQRGILRAGHDSAQRRIDNVVQRDRLPAAHHNSDLHVILQVVSDPGRIEHHSDAVLVQQRRGPDAGQLQQLRRVVGAAGHQHFLARLRDPERTALPIFDGASAASIEQNPLRLCGGFDLQVAAAPRGTKIGKRGAGATAAPCRGLEKPGALLGRAVEVGIGGNAGFRRRHYKGLRKRIGVPPVGHRQRAADAVKFVGAALLVFRLLEVGQHVVIAPAGVAPLPPAVIVLMLAANVEQAVDRTRSAQHLAARLEHGSPVQSRLRFGLVHPVDGLVLEQLAISERHMDPEVGILRPGFQQQHRIPAVGAQAIGEHASGRPGTDDDVVEFESPGQAAGFP